MSSDDNLKYRTQLRRAGYFFIPIQEDELRKYLSDSSVIDGKVIETAELIAIRENLLRVRMSNWLQLPKEAYWLETTHKAFIRVLKSLWKPGVDISIVSAFSNWIIEQVDVRGWAHCFGAKSGDYFVKTGRGAYILMLLTPVLDVPKEVDQAYSKWVEDNILCPLKEQFPDIFIWIVEWQRKWISNMTETDLRRNA